MEERKLTGMDYLNAATALLQRARAAHPVKGLYEAADLQWRWRSPRPTDEMPQLFWFDDSGPAAAMIATDWGGRKTLDPVLLPDATPEWTAHVVERGLVHADEAGFSGALELEVDRADDVMRDVLVRHGVTFREEGMVETWLAAGKRPAISPLHEGYRLASRADTKLQPHHMIKRSGAGIEQRLGQMSLYRPDLDLLVLDGDDNAAAYGLFWYDPATKTGLVEPMRTEADHQQRGLARHILTAGIDRLAAAGAARIKICFEPGNPASGGLYLSVGFEPVKRTDVFVRLGTALRGS